MPDSCPSSHLISSLLALFSRNCTKDSVPAGRADLIPNPSRLFLGFCCILNSPFVLSDDSISIPRLTIRFYLIRLFDAYEPFDREISSGAFQTRDGPFAPRLDSCPHFLVLRPIVGGPHVSLTHESLVRRGSVSHRERNSCSQTFPHPETPIRAAHTSRVFTNKDLLVAQIHKPSPKKSSPGSAHSPPASWKWVQGSGGALGFRTGRNPHG